MKKLTDKSDRLTRQRAWERVFLTQLRKTPNVSRACRAAKISRQAAYVHKKENPAFSEKWSDCLEQAVDDLAETAWKLANKGDSQLMIFLLKSHRPDPYQTTQRMEIDARLCGVLLLPEKENKQP